ncbi:hypothetical protein VTK56DRAFT_4765 [Thermocarpiscus australiensis]
MEAGPSTASHQFCVVLRLKGRVGRITTLKGGCRKRQIRREQEAGNRPHRPSARRFVGVLHPSSCTFPSSTYKNRIVKRDPLGTQLDFPRSNRFGHCLRYRSLGHGLHAIHDAPETHVYGPAKHPTVLISIGLPSFADVSALVTQPGTQSFSAPTKKGGVGQQPAFGVV